MLFARVRSFAHQSWGLLAERSAASALVAWLYAPVGVWAAYVTNWLQTDTPTGTWWILVIIGQFVVVGLLPLIGMAIHRWVQPRLRSLATFIGIAVTVVIHDRVVDVAAESLDIAPSLDLLTSSASVLCQTGLLLIISIRVSARSREQDQLDALANAETALAGEDQDLRIRVADVDQRIAIQIGLTIEPRIHVLDKQLADAERGGDIAIPVATLRSFVDDELLPLSHRLANAVTPWSVDMRPPSTSERPAKMTFPSRLTPQAFIRPLLSAGVIGLLALPSAVSRLQSIGAVLVTVAFMGIFGVVLAAARGLLRRRSFSVMWAFIASALLGGGASLFAVVVLAAPLEITQPRSLIISFAIGCSLGILCVIAAVQDERFSLMRDALGTHIESLEDSTSTMRQQLWVSRRRFGYALHGGLQSALHASMLRLMGPEPPTAEIISDVRADIRQAFIRATVESHDPPDLVSVCAEIAEMWGGLCDITWDISGEVTQMLRQSRIGSECSAEVIREAVQNAVRHGRAARVRISAEMDGGRLVLIVSDDGTWKEGQSGLGSRMLDQFCARWEREPVDSGTRIRAEIVISDRSGSEHDLKPTS